MGLNSRKIKHRSASASYGIDEIDVSVKHARRITVAMLIIREHLYVHRALRRTTVRSKQIDGLGDLALSKVPDADGTPKHGSHGTHQGAAGQDEVRGHHQVHIGTRGNAMGVEV